MSQLNFTFNGFKDKYKKEDLVVGDFNQYAYKVLYEDIDSENKFIFIFGEQSVGKTYLAKTFLEEKCYANLSVKNLNNYSGEEYILIDNLQEMSLEEEEALFGLYNKLIGSKTKLIITSRKPRSELNFKIPDLKSRIETFIGCPISQPEGMHLKAVWIKFLTDHQIRLKPDVIKYILKHVDNTQKDLIEVSCKCESYSEENNVSISLRNIKSIIES